MTSDPTAAHTMQTRLVPATAQSVTEAVELLAAGGLVALPTETVYGLGCDATRSEAVARLYEAKGRPSFNPLIAHVADLAMAAREGDFNSDALALAQAFWPGPLTLVVPVAASHRTCDLARAGLDSIALRMPAHPVARAVIAGLGRPIAAPSANLSGRVSATSAQHVLVDLAGRIDLILDAGDCKFGLESTIVACLEGPPAILRAGAIPEEAIAAALPHADPLRHSASDPNAPRAPGALLRHYAPAARLRLNVQVPDPDEAWLAFGPTHGHEPQDAATYNLSEGGDLREAAARLFAGLRMLEVSHARIAVAPIPDTGIGQAINDRLRRASTP
jgi:L-threonylcarbamoyladenylate synthase